MVLVAVACGGGDSGLDDTEQAMADAIAAQMLDDGDTTEAEAQCVGEGVVDEMGMDRLIEVGLDRSAVESGTGPDDVELSDEDIDSLLDPMLDCIDFAAVFTESMTSGDDAISEESADCIAAGISDDTIRSAARAGLTGDEFDPVDDQDVLGEVFDLMAECLTSEEFRAVTGG